MPTISIFALAGVATIRLTTCHASAKIPRRSLILTSLTLKHAGHHHPKPRSAAIVDDIVAHLSSMGYRDTEPRRLVIGAAAAQSRPFTAEDLCAALPCVGRATVFRGLRLLVETNQVCRVLLEDRELRYQLSHQGHHHHMLCAVCGASADLSDCDVEETLRASATAAGFQMSGHWLEIYGRCASCAAT